MYWTSTVFLTLYKALGCKKMVYSGANYIRGIKFETKKQFENNYFENAKLYQLKYGKSLEEKHELYQNRRL